jgi:hypothetical protein
METEIIERIPTFVTLNNKLLAEYFLVFRINESNSIQDFSKITNKYQLIFQNFKDEYQQQNLMYIDSLFVNIIADLSLEVLINKISSIQEYILSKKRIKLVEASNETNYFNYKFSEFIHLLLFGDISISKSFTQELNTNRVFCIKNDFGELEYYSIYEQKELQEKLIKELKIEIDYNLSGILNNELSLCLKFAM